MGGRKTFTSRKQASPGSFQPRPPHTEGHHLDLISSQLLQGEYGMMGEDLFRIPYRHVPWYRGEKLGAANGLGDLVALARSWRELYLFLYWKSLAPP